MDPVSQAAFGASWAQQAAGRGRTAAAAAVGGAAAMAPDLDTLIRSPTDPLLFLEYHRQFTHALSFIPVGALLVAVPLYWLTRRRLGFAETYLFAFLGYASHGLLDACTSYGTQLLWPFSDTRVAWSNVSVVDPLFTLPVLGLVALAAARRQPRYARLALMWAAAYLTLGVVQRERAEAAGADIAASRGHVPQRLEAKPALASLVLWKVIYEHDGRYYVDAVRTGFDTRVHAGDSIEKLDLAKHFPWLDRSSQQARDVERFRRISDGFLSPDPRVPGRIVDLRYSMVPNEIDAFWAVVLDSGAAPDEHADFVTTRERAPEQAVRLLDMMF
ncbi:MAG: metal-dependent hydrolase [Gammaproteobacteria bacterium]|nr:metal-dependent hydrolase [Gammaproteobacteria bacterium]